MQRSAPHETDTPRARLANLQGRIDADAEACADILARNANGLSEADAAAFDRIEARMKGTEAERDQLLAAHPGLAGDNLSVDEARALAFGTGSVSIAADGSHRAIPANADELTARSLDLDRVGAFGYEDAKAFSLGRFIRGLATGRVESDSVERRALSEGTDSAGGFLLPDPIGSQVIDRLRPATRVIEAGAQVVPLDGDVLHLPRIASGVTGAWRAEGDSVTAGSPTFDRVTLRPKSLAVAVKVSNEMLEDLSEAGARAIERELVNALAVQLDQAALNGTGSSNQPTGIVNTTGITTNANGTNGTTASWAMVGRAIRSVEVANATPTAVIAAPRTWHTLDGLTDSTGQPLRAPEYAASVARYSTNTVPTDLTVGSSSTCSQIIAGDFRRLILAVRPTIAVRIIRDSSRYLDTLETVLVAHVRCDVGVEQPAAFALETGVK